MSDIFISYSRRNSDFVRQLYEKLISQDLKVWVDWNDIPPTRDWWNEISVGIESANAFVFVISPDSLASTVCHLEIAHASLHNKRLIPILYIEGDINQAIAAVIISPSDNTVLDILASRDIVELVRNNWKEISRHNWLMFNQIDQIDASVPKLIEALQTDYEYVKQHTQWAIRAANWKHNDFGKGFLLRDAELIKAKRWLAMATKPNTKLTPPPSKLQKDYIRASLKKSSNRNLYQIGLAATVMFILIVSITLVASLYIDEYGFTGKFNILLTTIGEKGADDILTSGDSGTYLTELILADFDESKELFAEQGIDYLWSNQLITDDNVAQVLDDFGADVVIYGFIDKDLSTPQFVPQLYLSPVLSGANEIIDSNTFGAPIDLKLEGNSSIRDSLVAEMKLDEQFRPRVDALVEFLYGLAAFKAESYPVSNEHFSTALAVPEWSDTQGKEILYLWIGTLFERNYAKDKQANLLCPISTQAWDAEPSLNCALRSYEASVAANKGFSRGYLGIGNVYVSLAKFFADEGTTNCVYLRRAISEYENALTVVESPSLLIELKSYVNRGFAYMVAYNLGLEFGATDCLDNTLLDSARDRLLDAEKVYNVIIADAEADCTVVAETDLVVDEANEIAAQMYFELGLTYSYLGEVDNALINYDKAIEIADCLPEIEAGEEEDWQQVRWKANGQLATLLGKKAEATGNIDDWEESRDKAEIVIENQEYVDNKQVVSAAYYRAGLAYIALGNRDEALAAYHESNELATENMLHYKALQDALDALQQ